MTWWTATSVSVNSGQTIVNVDTGDDVQIAQEAGGLVIGNQPPVEIKRTFLDGGGLKKIELRQPWPYANQTTQPAVAFPTDADLVEATRILREIAADFDMQPTASSVAVRTSDGRLKVTNATESNDAVPRDQIDSLIPKTTSATDTTSGRVWRTNDLVKTTSATDSTPGRMLKVGDGGVLGNAVYINGGVNAPAQTQSGYVANAVTDRPSGFVGQLQTYKFQNGSEQRLTSQVFQAADNINFLMRCSDPAVINTLSGTPWRRLFHDGNILGTVSQTAGVPTGAIIQRGSNANGEFVRFADGTQICYRSGFQPPSSVSQVAGVSGLNRANMPTWTFPLAFVNASYHCFGAGSDNSNAGIAYSFGTLTTTSVIPLYFTNTTSVLSVDVRLIAIGRWF